MSRKKIWAVVSAAGLLTLSGVAVSLAGIIDSSQQNQAALTAFDVPNGVGANVPFIEYEAEGTRATTNGNVQGPDYTQATVASEASGRRFVALGQGQNVEFTLTAPANAVNVAYNVARGASGTLSVYVNGAKTDRKLALTSKYSYLENPNSPGAKLHHFFDHTRVMLGTTVQAGAKVRLQVDGGDLAANIDVADFENVGAPLPAPANAVSVTSSPYNADPTGGADATNAFNQAISAARGRGVPVWIPQGSFKITSPLPVDGITMQGAGPWYSVLRGTHLINITSATGNIKLSDFAAIGDVTQRRDDPDNFVMGSLGDGSVVSNIWIQHQKVGLWLMGPNSHLTIQNNRILDTTADGINFNGHVTDSTLKNNFVRNTGDDAIAIWSLHSPVARNTISNNTVVQPNLANGIVMYGGRDNTVSNNVVADTNALGSGIAVSNQQFINNGTFSPLAGTINITNNYVIRAGAMNPNWNHPMGAIRFDSYDFPYSNVSVKFSGGKIIDSPYSAFEFVDGSGSGRAVNGVTISDLTVDGVGTVVIQAETQGSATITNVTATRVGVAGVYNCPYPQGPPFGLNLGAGNSGLSSTVSGCAWPNPALPGTATAPAATTPATQQTTPASQQTTPASQQTTPAGQQTTTAPQQTWTAPQQPAGVDLAKGKSIAATSAVEGYGPTNAVDGNADTYWESVNNAFPQTTTVDLGSEQDVSKVILAVPPSQAWGPRTQRVALWGSVDDRNYREIVAARDFRFDPATGNTSTVTFGATRIRFLQLAFTANSGWPAAQLSCLQVYRS